MEESKNTKIIEITNELIINMIHEVRGQKVMLDFELAELYGYETKRLNEQIKRNIERFPEEFMFQLTSLEVNNILMSQNATSSWGGLRKLPFAFTEQGVYMLMTVLKGEIAVKQSIALIKAFKAMKDYLVNNESLLSIHDILKISKQTNENTDSIKKLSQKVNKQSKQLELVMENFNDTSKCKHFAILNGQRIEADIAYQQIYSNAESSIVIVDDYINIKTLSLLKGVKNGIDIKILSDNKAKDGLEQYMLDDFIKDTNININLVPTNNKFHDRYILIDNKKLYHCGPSSKDAGNKIATISTINDIETYKLLFKEN